MQIEDNCDIQNAWTPNTHGLQWESEAYGILEIPLGAYLHICVSKYFKIAPRS